MSDNGKGPAFDPLSVEAFVRNPYPPPNDRVLSGKSRRALGDPPGLTNFEGTPILVTDAGEQQLQPGMCACFPAASEDAHRLENRSDALVRFLEVGNRSDGEQVKYPDDDMIMNRTADDHRSFTKLDGTPF